MACSRILSLIFFFIFKLVAAIAIVFRIVSRIYPRKSVLYVGHCYYNPWYLSRALRSLGWKADVLNWDNDKKAQIFYHGQDFSLDYDSKFYVQKQLFFYLRAILTYDIFHFSNAHGIVFGNPVHEWFSNQFGENSEIHLLRKIGRKIVYSNNGCLDGVSQSKFSTWGSDSVCSICVWKDNPSVCSDERNLKWGNFRNSVTDFQCNHGGNRVDCNDDPKVHEVPEFYCLDPNFWYPNLEIPESFKLKSKSKNSIVLYHAVGNMDFRTSKDGVNIKSTHIYLPLIDKMKKEGYSLELISPTNIPNKEVRYLQAQADIFLEMLTYGWFGANAREAMMLGKPVICYIRPEWLKTIAEEIPDYVKELPIISATPETVEEILKDLIAHPEKRVQIGNKSREFAVKWHSNTNAAKRFNEIYSNLLKGEFMLRNS